jgi:hypothetical protein
MVLPKESTTESDSHKDFKPIRACALRARRWICERLGITDVLAELLVHRACEFAVEARTSSAL